MRQTKKWSGAQGENFARKLPAYDEPARVSSKPESDILTLGGGSYPAGTHT